jgi:hypothetical protein
VCTTLKLVSRAFAALALLGCAAAPVSLAAQALLPDAPSATAASDGQAVPATRPNTPEAVRARRWEGVIEPGERTPALSNRDKLLFPLRESIRPIVLVPIVISATWGIYSNNDPKLGTDGTGWAERAGEAALRQTSIRVFSDGLLPILTHEDPRYRRQAYGPVFERGEYAIRRTFVNQRDNGSLGFNWSDILGRGMAGALTMAYYPEQSQSASVVFRTWGLAVAGSAGVNLFQEFWPDIQRKVLHRRTPGR